MYSQKLDVMRGILCLSGIQIPLIVKLAEPTLKMASKSRLIQKGFNLAMKKTMFAHFCGGESLNEVKGTVAKLESNGIQGILDYAAEAPIAGDGKVDFKAAADRTIEALKFINQNSKYPSMATKMTGLVPHETLLAASELIHCARNAFLFYSNGIDDVTEGFGNPKDFQYLDSLVMNYETYQSACSKLNCMNPIPDNDFHDIIKWIVSLDPYQNYSIKSSLYNNNSDKPPYTELTFHQWEFALMNLFLDSNYKNHPMWSLLKPVVEHRRRLDPFLIEPPTQELINGNERLSFVLNELISCSNKRTTHQVKPFLMMDAEATNIQPAIDLITNHHTLRVNAPGAILFGNTYQHYLKETYSRMMHDYNVHMKYHVPFGAKMVRGAYMKYEAATAKDLGREYPVHDTIENTHQSYNDAIRFATPLCGEGSARVTFGSHNEISIQLVLDEVRRLQNEGVITPIGSLTIGQLLGMSDAECALIAKHHNMGVLAGKYVPYGPIELVLPYLLRRIEENGDALSRVKRDKHYLYTLLRHHKFQETRLTTNSSGNHPITSGTT